MSASWSGAEFLEQINGLIEEFPPIRVLFAIYRLKSSGLFTVQRQRELVHLELQGGKVVGIRGVPGLLARIGVKIGPNADLMDLVGKAIAGGTPPNTALIAAAEGLGDILAGMVGETDGYVRFEDGLKPRGAPIALPLSIPRIIHGGLTRTRPAEMLKKAFSRKNYHEVRLSLPEDSRADTWGLTPGALRLLRLVKMNADRKPTLQQILRKGGDDRLQAADHLLQLGLFTLFVPAEAPRRPAPIHIVKTETEPPPQDASTTLTAQLKRLRRLPPWEVLGLKRSANVNDEGIDRANRMASRQFHPDGFISESRAVQALAADCFSVLQEAYITLKDKALREEVKTRLEATERGEQYVTDRERAEAEMNYSRGQVVFRKKEYTSANKLFERAIALDSNNWRFTYMVLRTRYHLGKSSGDEVAQKILDIDGPRGLTRADVLFEVAEILMRENAENRAHQLYKKVLDLNPEHIGARRWVRIRKMRASAEDEKSASGLFSGLFRRKKK